MDGARRVWTSDWADGRFVVVNPEDFRTLEQVCARFSFALTEADDDFEGTQADIDRVVSSTKGK